ncbi:MAG: uncharacterized protein KVP18_000318 [Porospora cf. gigantea A]|uniref:uncharacterized protein n=1 Tax=Porospora cf. gigantea A TaxID=2853593 RepID=UPI00355A2837|nr:MAG: hypothetical protein KVP18_000318 [Porospora cf. gigantea A]
MSSSVETLLERQKSRKKSFESKRRLFETPNPEVGQFPAAVKRAPSQRILEHVRAIEQRVKEQQEVSTPRTHPGMTLSLKLDLAGMTTDEIKQARKEILSPASTAPSSGEREDPAVLPTGTSLTERLLWASTSLREMIMPLSINFQLLDSSDESASAGPQTVKGPRMIRRAIPIRPVSDSSECNSDPSDSEELMPLPEAAFPTQSMSDDSSDENPLYNGLHREGVLGREGFFSPLNREQMRVTEPLRSASEVLSRTTEAASSLWSSLRNAVDGLRSPESAEPHLPNEPHDEHAPVLVAATVVLDLAPYAETKHSVYINITDHPAAAARIFCKKFKLDAHVQATLAAFLERVEQEAHDYPVSVECSLSEILAATLP